MRVARAIVGKDGGIIPGREDLGEFAAISSEDFDEIVPKEELDVESQLQYGQGPPVELRVSLVKYLEVAMRQGRGDSFFETGSRGAIAPGESDNSVALAQYTTAQKLSRSHALLHTPSGPSRRRLPSSTS